MGEVSPQLHFRCFSWRKLVRIVITRGAGPLFTDELHACPPLPVNCGGAEITQAMLDAIGLVLPGLNNTATNLTEPSVSFIGALAQVYPPYSDSNL